MNSKASRNDGFSLIELLVVMLIIGIVAAFLVPATGTILKGSQISQASQIVSDQFNLARQYALAKNHPVQVRLIQYQDPGTPGEVLNGAFQAGTGQFRAIQIVDALDGGVDKNGVATVYFYPVDKPQILPQGVIFDSDATANLSTLIVDKSQGTDTTVSSVSPVYVKSASGNDPALPNKIGQNYSFVYFRFMPDGSTDLPPKSKSDPNGNWFVTIHNFNDKPGVVPANFFTLQVDPVGGTLKKFRPGI